MYMDFEKKENHGNKCDFCSLYPTAMFSDPYPWGTPQKIVYNPPVEEYYDEKNNQLKQFGYYHMEIAEQRGQYMAVLPERIGTKTVFALCHKCAERTIVDREKPWPAGACDHEIEER